MGNIATRDMISDRIVTLIDQFITIPADAVLHERSKQLFTAVRHQGIASSGGGKRLRALLAIATWQAAHAGGDHPLNGMLDASDSNPQDPPQAMVDLACAIEIFQTAALVHDDIIDESDLRRGQPSAHRSLAGTAGDTTIGAGLGLMLGDILATCSIDVATKAARSVNNSMAITESFLAMQRDVEIGQVLDLAVELAPLGQPEHLIDAALTVFRLKTASYTTIAPIRLALLASGMSPAAATASAECIGTPLGVAFQLCDDLLDVTGSSQSTGKPVGGDIREGKRTVLLADALRMAGESDRDELVRMFSHDHGGGRSVQRAIALFHDTGAIDYSRRRISDLWSTCSVEIGKAPLSPEGRHILEQACSQFITAPINVEHEQ